MTTLIKRMAAALLSLAIVAAPGMALAEQITWYFSGPFASPATGSCWGSYVYDTGSGNAVSVTVNTTQGLSSAGVWMPARSYTYAGSTLARMMTVAESTPALGKRGGQFYAAPTFTAPTSADFTEGLCLNNQCTLGEDPSTTRRTTLGGTATLSQTPLPVPSSPPAPVPTMSEWAMILFGLVLAGGAGVLLARRRMA